MPPSVPDDSEAFEISDAPETATSASAFEGLNVCRVAALSTMFGSDGEAVRQLSSELQVVGFSEGLRTGEHLWGGAGFQDMVSDLHDQRINYEEPDRVRLWQDLNVRLAPQAAFSFLVGVLGSALERESAAAAAALWRLATESGEGGALLWRRWWYGHPFFWDLLDGIYQFIEHPGIDLPSFPWPPDITVETDRPEQEAPYIPWNSELWAGVYRQAMRGSGEPDAAVIAFLAGLRLGSALRSSDPVTRSFAMAASQPTVEQGSNDNTPAPVGIPPAPPGGPRISTMIHGTWGWPNTWWRPGGNFHEFIRDNHRPNLYSGGARFAWSGALSRRQRQQAALDFRDWSSEMAPNGLQTVFAHSYGGDVAARAIFQSVQLGELVLLSVPVNRNIRAVVSQPGLRVVDVRLHLDPFLGLSRRRQRITNPATNLTVVFLGWSINHFATHDPHIWQQNNIAAEGGL